MDRELKELIDVAIRPLERFRFDRKRIVAAALAEVNELLNDGYYDVLATNIFRDLKHKEKLRRGQESLMLRKVVDRISRLPGEEDPSFSAIVDQETKPGIVTDLTQNYHDYGSV
jgi:hypothetical protein